MQGRTAKIDRPKQLILRALGKAEKSRDGFIQHLPKFSALSNNFFFPEILVSTMFVFSALFYQHIDNEYVLKTFHFGNIYSQIPS